jgi:hypothetical protein
VFSLSLGMISSLEFFFGDLLRVLFVNTEVRLVDDFDFFGVVTVSLSFGGRELLDLGLAFSSSSSLPFPADRREIVLSVLMCNDFGRSGEVPTVRRGGVLLFCISPRMRPAWGWFGGSSGVFAAINGLNVGGLSFNWLAIGWFASVGVRLCDLVDDGIIAFRTDADLFRRCSGRSTAGVEVISGNMKSVLKRVAAWSQVNRDIAMLFICCYGDQPPRIVKP